MRRGCVLWKMHVELTKDVNGRAECQSASRSDIMASVGDDVETLRRCIYAARHVLTEKITN